jgi:hypothetical protein
MLQDVLHGWVVDMERGRGRNDWRLMASSCLRGVVDRGDFERNEVILFQLVISLVEEPDAIPDILQTWEFFPSYPVIPGNFGGDEEAAGVERVIAGQNLQFSEFGFHLSNFLNHPWGGFTVRSDSVGEGHT